MVARVLMIAFHFPPSRGGSGILRSIAFARHLPEHGWQPVVLSAHPRAYATHGNEFPLPADLPVTRAFALDTTRHLSWRGRYARLLALPDPWSSWVFGAVPAGLRLIRRYRPAVLWSTYPIATAHLIALLLHRCSGLPWVADLRDPIVDELVPANPLKRKVCSWLEQQIVRHANVLVFTAPGTMQMYAGRYRELSPQRMLLIENGYDEDDFSIAAQLSPPVRDGGPLQLLHSGTIYPEERDPIPFFDALAALKQAGAINASRLRVVLRASGHDDYLRPLLQQRAIEDLVTLAPALPYHAALAEMLHSDALLLLQAANCNHQLPAKLYECLRSGRPLLLLSDSDGDTAKILGQHAKHGFAPLNDMHAIKSALLAFLGQLQASPGPIAPPMPNCSRRVRSAQLASLLARVAADSQRQTAAPVRNPP